jgi:hypothetical protein
VIERDIATPVSTHISDGTAGTFIVNAKDGQFIFSTKENGALEND